MHIVDNNNKWCTKENYFVFSFLLRISKNRKACLGMNRIQNTGSKMNESREMTHLCLMSATSRWERGSISIKLSSSIAEGLNDEDVSIRFHWYQEDLLLKRQKLCWGPMLPTEFPLSLQMPTESQLLCSFLFVKEVFVLYL